MNIIELTRKIINDFPKINEFSNGVHIDYTDDGKDNEFGLSSTGDTLIKKDILGNETRRHSFVLYAINRAYDDYNRLSNSSFLLELGYYLEKIKNLDFFIDMDSETIKGKLVDITSSNGMLYSWQDGTVNEMVAYQIQIYVNYKIEREDK